MRNFIDYFIRNEIAANLLMVGLLLLGVFGMLNMKSTFFPETESRIITIQAVYPGASPEEVEEGIINKIEENLKGLTGVERYTSTSRENAGTVTVEVLRDYDTDLIVQDVKNAVDRISSFPVGMEPLVVYKRENLGFAISFGISGNVDLKTLKRYGREVEEELRKRDLISKVALSGFPDEEIEIAFRESDLRSYNLTFAQAATAVRSFNLDITGGTIKGDTEELLLRARNKNYYADGFRDIIVKTNPNGSVVRLHQVADVTDQWSDSDPQRTYINGEAAVVVTVQNTLEEDMIPITDEVRSFIEAFNESNTDVQATVIRDGSIVLRQRIELLTENGVIGFLLVVILLAMFLHWRLAFWVALAIPISFAGMFLVAYLMDVTINVISLFGMILVIGILVDDGIVIGESIYQEYENGKPRMRAALDGTMKVLPAVFAAIVTTVIAFSTFLFLDGQLGDIFYEMAIVVIFSLVFSLVEGAVVLPTHVAHSHALDPKAKKNKVQRAFENFLFGVRDKFYAPILRAAMRFGFLTFTIMVGVLILTFSMFRGGLVQGTFFPSIESDNAQISLQLPAGTREGITEKWLNHIEEAIWEANRQLNEEYPAPEGSTPVDIVKQVQKTVGPTTYQGSVDVTLADGEARDLLGVTNRMVVNRIRELTGEISEAEVITFGARSIFGKPVSLSLTGENYTELKAATQAMQREMQSLAQLQDVVDNNQEGLREISVKLKEKAYFLGLDISQVLSQVRAGFFGFEAQRLQRGRDEVRVWVRYDERDRRTIDDLENMRVRFADGREFPLSEIATLDIARGVTNIYHIDGRREVKVEADVSDDDVSVADITTFLQDTLVPKVLAQYPTVKPLYEGQNREQAKTAESISIIMPVVLLLMFFSIAITFKSIGQTIAVFLLIPFGMIGVILGHFAMGAPISLFSFLGVIALVGILVNDALVFVSTYNDNLKEGMPQPEALYQAGVSRFRPIVLTTFTTFAGLVPLLLEKSLQAQFLIPMAISVSFGLLVITVIILILLPVLLNAVNRFKYLAANLVNNDGSVTLESVEPATEAKGGYGYLWYIVVGLIALWAGLYFVL